VNKEWLSHASLSVYMEDGNTGKTIASRNDEKSLIPAYTQKPFTTDAALHILEPKYKYLLKLSVNSIPSFDNLSIQDNH